MTDEPKSTFAKRVRPAKPRAKKYDICDDVITGLGLRVGTSGHRAFFLRRNVRGPIRLATIGSADAMIVREACAEARRPLACQSQETGGSRSKSIRRRSKSSIWISRITTSEVAMSAIQSIWMKTRARASAPRCPPLLNERVHGAQDREGVRKCYAPDTRISKAHLDSFISASAREPFTARIVVDTGDGWGPNAVKTVTGLDRECTVLRFGDLASCPFDWPDLVRQQPEALSWRAEPYRLRPHQQSAFDDTIAGFVEHDRGKLIMACGTGKTFAALRIAEEVAGVGGRVLYLVPSISLFQQSMREWAEQRSMPHRYVGICSDTRAGRNDEDATLQELEIPVTTDPAVIGAALKRQSGAGTTWPNCNTEPSRSEPSGSCR